MSLETIYTGVTNSNVFKVFRFHVFVSTKLAEQNTQVQAAGSPAFIFN